MFINLYVILLFVTSMRYSENYKVTELRSGIQSSTKVNGLLLHNLTKRQSSDEENWDLFPIVHDYFYESDEDEYINNKNYRPRPLNHHFRPLCQSVRKRIELRSDVYEYRPSHYVETVCKRFSTSDSNSISYNTHNQICMRPGFRCVQRVQTIYITRKRYDRDCWENAKEIIAAGCDCMWPDIPIQSSSAEE